MVFKNSTAFLLTLTIFSTTALSFSLNPVHLLSPSHAKRASKLDSQLNFPFFVNCWANPGARSEVDFFTSYPSNFGSAFPNSSTTVSENENFVWENGGSATDPDNNQLTWTITDKNASTNAQAGTATDGNIKYMILRDTDSTLYKQDGFNCIVVYRLQQTSGGTATTSEPPSSNATTAPDSTSSSVASAPAQTTPASTPSVSTAASSNSSSGLSSGAQVGVGVGVGVGGALALGALGFFLWTRRRFARRGAGPMAVDEKRPFAPGADGAAEAGAVGGGAHLRSELHQDPLQELGAESGPVEVPGSAGRQGGGGGARFELDAGEYGR